MSYSYSERFYATLSAPTTVDAKITITGTASSPDAQFTLHNEYFSKIDNKPECLNIDFDSLERAFAYFDAYRKLAANIAHMQPNPYRVEIAGLDKDGNVTDDYSFVITKNEGEKLPYRLQMYRDGAPCDTYTDFRRVIDAVYEAGDLNALTVSSVVRTEEYVTSTPSPQNYRQSFYEIEDADVNGAIYISHMERKNEAGEYEKLSNWSDYHFSPQDIESDVERNNSAINDNRFVDVTNVTLELDDSTRTLVLQADLIIPNRTEPITHTQTLSFDKWIEEDWNSYEDELAGMNGVTDNLAALYEVHKDDFYYNNKTYHSILTQFERTLTLAATDNTTKNWYKLSPLALNEIKSYNPARQTHSVDEEKQRTTKKEQTVEGR